MLSKPLLILFPVFCFSKQLLVKLEQAYAFGSQRQGTMIGVRTETVQMFKKNWLNFFYNDTNTDKKGKITLTLIDNR